MPKRYTGTFLLGRQSPTEDIEGDVTELPDAPIPTREQIAAAAARFVGRIDQRPPAFSALKVAGRRAYQARPAGPPAGTGGAAGRDLRHRGRGVSISRVDLGRGVRQRHVHPLARPRPGRVVGHRRGDVGAGAHCDRRFFARRRRRSPRVKPRQLARGFSSRRFGPSSICRACNSRPTRSRASAPD